MQIRMGFAQGIRDGALPEGMRFALLALTKVSKVSGHNTMDMPCLLFQGVDFIRRQVAFVVADVQIVNQFLKRTPRVQRKFDLLEVVVSSMPLGDVARQGNRGPTNLASQFESLKVRQSSSHRVHGCAKLARQLVHFQVLEGLETRTPSVR